MMQSNQHGNHSIKLTLKHARSLSVPTVLWNDADKQSLIQPMSLIIESPSNNDSSTSNESSPLSDQMIDRLNNEVASFSRTRSFTPSVNHSVNESRQQTSDTSFVHKFPSIKSNLMVRINQPDNQLSFMVHRHVFAHHSKVVDRLLTQADTQTDRPIGEIVIDDFSMKQSTNPFDSPVHQPADAESSQSGWFAYFNAMYEIESGAQCLSDCLLDRSLDRLIDCAVHMESWMIVRFIDRSVNQMLTKQRIRFHEQMLIRQPTPKAIKASDKPAVDDASTQALNELMTQDKQFLSDLKDLCERAHFVETLQSVEQIINQLAT